MEESSTATISIAPSRRARPIYRVFVSSTWVDLQPERRALMEALNRMEEMRFVGMEFFGNRPDDTHDASIDQVDKCDVFVGIIGHRYGSGITEAEYRRARSLGLPCFVYFKRDDTARPELTDNDLPLAAKLAVFKQELLRDHTVKEIGSPEELAANATADLHNWVAARWISVEREAVAHRPPPAAPDADRTNVLRLLERIEQDWIKGVLEASLHHKAWLELGLDWREDAVEHPWDRIVVAADRPIRTLQREDSITGVFDAAQHTLLVLGEPGAGKTTTVLELARDLIARARGSAAAPAPVVLALSTWRGQQPGLLDWLVAELGLRYQVPKRIARTWLEEGRLVLILDGLDEVTAERRAACVEAINAFAQAHPPPGLAVTCRVIEYNALATKLRLRSAICLQPLTPEQIEHYFKAAGASLDHLRLALREDAALRELARSPLMLSVMTMAWHGIPAGTAAPFGSVQTPEELRHRLFDAYVQAALRRRGKASGGYTTEQTTTWLGWLACRMKENGHTVFAVEQLQPGWLDGPRRQLGYYLTTRLLGTVGLALPFFAFDIPWGAKAIVAALSLTLGLYIGALDFAFARHGWGGSRRALLRFWSLLGASVLLVVGSAFASRGSFGSGYGLIYLLMATLAFCTALDVRALDIKPAGSMQWSWRLALNRGLTALVFINLFVAIGGLSEFFKLWSDRGRGAAMTEIGGPWLLGLVLALVPVGVGWVRLRPRRTVLNFAKAITLVMALGQVLGMRFFGPADNPAWAVALMGELVPMAAFGVFSGFASTMIDPGRPRHAGAWFWLRVPVVAFFVVGLIMTVPGLMMLVLDSNHVETQAHWLRTTLIALGVGGGCGLVAFFRFGGFNGAQHFFLRWQLAQSGDLPPRAESFFNHAAQLALMQKVGLGYRFVHALLLEHLAVARGGAAARAGAAAARPAADAAGKRGRAAQAGRLVALAGLFAGAMLLFLVLVVALALWRSLPGQRTFGEPEVVLGIFGLGLWLAIPALYLSAAWWWRCSWRGLAGAYLALGLVLGWLAWDAPVTRHPGGREEVAPLFPDAEKSHAVLMRYGYRHPAGKTFQGPAFVFNESPAWPKPWPDFLREHRTDLEANWIALQPVRDWIAELNGFDRVGDLNGISRLGDLTGDDAEMPSYRVRIAYLQNAMAIASLRALDGQGDEALAMLRPLLELGGKIEVSSRGISRWSLGREMQNDAIVAAGFVLDVAPVSAAARQQFAGILARSGGESGGARHLYALRSAATLRATDDFGQAVGFATRSPYHLVTLPFDVAGPFVFNRQATRNRVADLYADLEELAGRRGLDEADQRLAQFLAEENRPRFKNVGGAWFNWMIAQQLIERLKDERQRGYWVTEDRRAALHDRLLHP